MSNEKEISQPDYSGATLEEILEIMVNSPHRLVRSLAKNEIIRREENFRKSIQDALNEIEADERLGYPTATVVVNAPLALIQCGLDSQRRALKFVLKALNTKDGEK